MKINTIYKSITALSIVGIGLAIYLLYNYLAPVPSEFCAINATVNCDAVTKGSLATIFGIPVAVVGLVGYIAILFGSIKKWGGLILGMSTFGMLFCLRLTFLEIFRERVLCPVCMSCQVIMLIIFGLSIYLVKHKETTS
ncbi:MAG: vitamin K epoxide reductase family protein [Candidatus Roizmanbacteria bacterium]|nr:vitamin K epoxide reductase family protein [Candidatus Roizmanbacteria bacterium]